MPGWQQIGAVWLPLPHVLNMIPVQVDAWYRTGASAIAMSVASMAVGAWALASLIIGRTGSIAGGARRRGAAPRQPERAVSPEHADDRTAAVRHDPAGAGADGGLARSRRAGLAATSRVRAGCRVHDAVRSLADLRQRPCAGAGRAAAQGHAAAERGHGGREAGGLPGDRGPTLSPQQPVDGRRVVRQQRLLRRRRTMPWAGRSSPGSRCAKESIASPGRRSCGRRTQARR